MMSVEARALILVMAVVVPAAHGIWLDLPGSGLKCVSEELHTNVVVLADYNAFYSDRVDVNSTVIPSISVKVTSPHGNDLYHKDKVTYGQFAFTTTEAGNHVACFWVDGDHQTGKTVSVGIQWKTGIATKDWDSVAKKEKIEGLDLELRKLEDSVEAIHQNLISMMTREMAMRDVNETTNARVARYSIMSLGVCILVSVLQLWYLRQYFHKNKLI